MTDKPNASAGKPQTSAASEDFPAEFARVKKTIISPAFEAVGAKLKQAGHEINIADEVDGKISIHIVPAGAKKSIHPYNWFPTLSFFGVPAKKTIGLQGRNARRNSEGTPGTRGDFKPGQISPELVEKELMKFVGEIANW